jgi:hypothetical protein
MLAVVWVIATQQQYLSSHPELMDVNQTSTYSKESSDIST